MVNRVDLSSFLKRLDDLCPQQHCRAHDHGADHSSAVNLSLLSLQGRTRALAQAALHAQNPSFCPNPGEAVRSAQVPPRGLGFGEAQSRAGRSLAPCSSAVLTAPNPGLSAGTALRTPEIQQREQMCPGLARCS